MLMILEIYAYSELIKSYADASEKLEVFGIALTSVYVISIIIIYFIIIHYHATFIENNNLILMKGQVQAIQDQYKLREMKEEELRILRHDMKHILITVSSLINEDKKAEALEFIDNYVNTITATKGKVYCNDSIINSILNYYFDKAEKDDVFLVHAGTVHSLGAGLLVAEIQESSNITYRLYDYDRIDKNGMKRELHIDKALKVVDYSLSQPPRQPLRVLRYRRGVATEFLARCRYFEVSRMLVNTDEETVTYISFSSDSLSFRVLLCIEGEGKMSYDSKSLGCVKGNCIFVPADSIEIHISVKATFLDIRA